MVEPITVLLADDHFVVRHGTAALLAGIEGVKIVGEADDGLTAVAKAIDLEPDVILMDIVCRARMASRPRGLSSANVRGRATIGAWRRFAQHLEEIRDASPDEP